MSKFAGYFQSKSGNSGGNYNQRPGQAGDNGGGGESSGIKYISESDRNIFAYQATSLLQTFPLLGLRSPSSLATTTVQLTGPTVRAQ